MSQIRTSQAARFDLEHIWSYIAVDNPSAADRFVERIQTRWTSYAHQPAIGELCLDLARDIRCFSVERYVIYYKPVSTPRSFNPRRADGAKERAVNAEAKRLTFQSAPRVRGESRH